VQRKKVGDKVKGAAAFFVTDNSELGITKNTVKDSKQDSIEDSIEDSVKDSKQSNDNDTTQDTTQYTNKYTVEMPDKTELVCERLVANVTKTQKKYVKDTAKKFENESAFVRFMLDYFIQNIEIK
jgi:hypothetical protein